MQVNKTFVFFEGARDCKNFLVPDIMVSGNVWCQALQTTVFAQPIRENRIFNITIMKRGRALIASKDLCQSTSSGTRNFTAAQLDFETPGLE
jgi:hypothetical protein